MIPAERFQKALENFFGLREFRPGQLEIVNSVVNGFDTLAVMPTASGKSICYQLPAMLSDGLTIVITPLVSLMKDQVAQINRRAAVATQLDSSLEPEEIQSRLRLVRSEQLKLLYVAPERLQSRTFLDTVTKVRISLLAVDEAHCISQWGHDFRPHYLRISEFVDLIGRPTILALTATATPEVQDDIITHLAMRSPRVYVRGFARPNLSFRVMVESGKSQTTLKYINSHEGAGIIYASTRKSVDETYEFLKSQGIDALRYHAGLTDSERSFSQSAFLKSDHIMVATNAFGMGINKPEVRFVIHSEVPGTLEAYYQEAGRAGRDGKFAECILLFHKKDLAVQDYFINSLYPPREVIIRVYNSIFDSLSIPVGIVSQEYVTVSSEKIAALTKLNMRTVESVIRMMAQENLISMMPNISVNSFVRSTISLEGYKRAIERTSSRDSKAVLETLLRLHGTAFFDSQRPITLEDVAHKSDLNVSTVIRTLGILQRSGLLEYKPPSEGITFKMISDRRSPDRLLIDFEKVSLLKLRAEERLAKITSYAKTTDCRTNYILDYFGADEMEGGCGNCDNCSVRKSLGNESSEGIELLNLQEINQTILSLVKETAGKYGRTTYCKILLGESATNKQKEESVDRFLGRFQRLQPQLVYSSFDFLVSRGYLIRNNLIYPTYSITQDGTEYLETGFAKPSTGPFPFRRALYRALREERRAIAGELHLPVFNVCNDESLVRIANERPLRREQIEEYVSRDGAKSRVIADRLLQVCLDFVPANMNQFSGDEQAIYEFYLEKMTASEIAAAISASVQHVIETLERIKETGTEIDMRRLIERKRFNLIRSELQKSGDIGAAHAAVRESELAEIMLVSRLIDEHA